MSRAIKELSTLTKKAVFGTPLQFSYVTTDTFSDVVITVFANEDITILVQHSPDGVNADYVETHTIPKNVGFSIGGTLKSNHLALNISADTVTTTVLRLSTRFFFLSSVNNSGGGGGGGTVTVTANNTDVQVTTGATTDDYIIGIGDDAALLQRSMIINDSSKPNTDSTTGFGYQCLGTSTASNNTAIGERCLASNTGGNNVAAGSTCGRYFSGGYSCVLIGHACSREFSAAKESCIIGGSACLLNTPDQACCLGFQCLYNGSSLGAVALGYNTAQQNAGLKSVSCGWNCASGSSPDYSVNIGAGCTPSVAVNGRLNWGASMEGLTPASAVSREAMTDLVTMSWNGDVIKIPCIKSTTATSFNLDSFAVTSTTLPIGDLSFEDYTTGWSQPVAVISTKYELDPGTVLLTNSSTVGSLPFFDMQSNGNLRYLGAQTTFAQFTVSISGSGLAVDIWEFEGRLNGVTKIPRSGFRVNKANTEDFAAAFSFVYEMTTNDYISVWFSNEAGTTNLLLKSLVISCTMANGA